MKYALFAMLIISTLQFSYSNSVLYKTSLMRLLVDDQDISYSMNEGVDWDNIPQKITLKKYKKNNLLVPIYFDSWDKSLLILKDQNIAISYIPGRSRIVFFGYSENITSLVGGGGLEPVFSPEIKQVSSFLTEGKISYNADNLTSLDLEKSWVEGVPGYGIGEFIELNKFRGNGLYFFNGFVSFEKPNLYEENSRVKKIKVTDTISSKFIIFNIDDTPNPQLLKLGELKEWELSIEILDVYKGTKYSDTCINAIQCTIFDVKK